MSYYLTIKKGLDAGYVEYVQLIDFPTFGTMPILLVNGKRYYAVLEEYNPAESDGVMPIKITKLDKDGNREFRARFSGKNFYKDEPKVSPHAREWYELGLVFDTYPIEYFSMEYVDNPQEGPWEVITSDYGFTRGSVKNTSNKPILINYAASTNPPSGYYDKNKWLLVPGGTFDFTKEYTDDDGKYYGRNIILDCSEYDLDIRIPYEITAVGQSENNVNLTLNLESGTYTLYHVTLAIVNIGNNYYHLVRPEGNLGITVTLTHPATVYATMSLSEFLKYKDVSTTLYEQGTMYKDGNISYSYESETKTITLDKPSGASSGDVYIDYPENSVSITAGKPFRVHVPEGITVNNLSPSYITLVGADD